MIKPTFHEARHVPHRRARSGRASSSATRSSIWRTPSPGTSTARAAAATPRTCRPLRQGRPRLRRERRARPAPPPTRSSPRATRKELPAAFDGRVLLACRWRDVTPAGPPAPPALDARRLRLPPARGDRPANRGLEMIPEFDQFPVFYFTNHHGVVGPGDVHVRKRTPRAARLRARGAPSSSGGAGKNLTMARGRRRPSSASRIMNDWSARALQMEEMKLNLGPAKGKDFATSLGPVARDARRAAAAHDDEDRTRPGLRPRDAGAASTASRCRRAT